MECEIRGGNYDDEWENQSSIANVQKECDLTRRCYGRVSGQTFLLHMYALDFLELKETAGKEWRRIQSRPGRVRN